MRLLYPFKAAALVLAATTRQPALSQKWPSEPTCWIVSYTHSGITDSATLMVAQKIQEQAGWTILLDNKPGANSIEGADLAAKAPADGLQLPVKTVKELIDFAKANPGKLAFGYPIVGATRTRRKNCSSKWHGACVLQRHCPPRIG